MASNWWGQAGDKKARDKLFEWLETVPGTPASQNGYDRLERLYRINEDPGRFTYEAFESALDRGTGRSWRDDPGGQSFVDNWLARRQGLVAGGSNAAAGNTSNPSPLSIDPSRGTGEESDIMNALKLELNTAQQSIADLQARQAQEIQATQASYMSQIKDLQSAFDQRYGALESNMLQQQMNFQSQTNLLNQQVQAAQNAYQQQVQLTQNLQSAYVPPAEQTAAGAAIGDQRSPEQTGRISSNNSLSSLSILSGLGTSANPLAGLQLA
jgi:hypothetical protein